MRSTLVLGTGRRRPGRSRRGARIVEVAKPGRTLLVCSLIGLALSALLIGGMWWLAALSGVRATAGSAAAEVRSTALREAAAITAACVPAREAVRPMLADAALDGSELRTLRSVAASECGIR